jgi:hypothetical protein
VRWKVFFDQQQKKPDYLRAGNQVTATIRTSDGVIELGEERNTVVEK